MDSRSDSNVSNIPAHASDDFKIRGAASRDARGKKTSNGDPEACAICLEAITERAVAVPCNHLSFDFLCLVSWLQERSSCPLCNAAVTEVQYDFRGPDDYKRYRVPPKEVSQSQSDSSYEQTRRRRGQDFIRRRTQGSSAFTAQASSSGEDPALEKRRQVYRLQQFSLRVGANSISQHRDFTPSNFENSMELQRRARMFLRRELQVFSFLDTAAAPRAGNREFLLEYVVAILKSNELKGADGHAENLLADYLGRENAGLLLHELEAWLRSPYAALTEWDRHVQYFDGQSAGESKQADTRAR